MHRKRASDGISLRTVLLCAALLFAVNLAITAKLFAVEYSAYTGSIEGTFVAIPRIMAAHPFRWSWWPFWNGGLPYENAYLPFSHWLTAAFMLLTGLSAGRSFHIVTGALYALGAVTLFVMALELSRKLVPSFIAALAYSCLSLSALLVPAIRSDTGGIGNLRRLQALVFYGESPHTVALTLLPLAIICYSRALKTRSRRWMICAGILAAAVVLSNAFGIVALAIALFAWLLVYRSTPWWRSPATVVASGVLVYAWISPWLSPAMIRAIRANAPTAGGDFRYTLTTWITLCVLLIGGFLLWWGMRRADTPGYLQFFVLFAYLPTAFVLLWYGVGIAVIPQPGRYQLQLDWLLVLPLVFGAALLLERTSHRVRLTVASLILAALAAQSLHAALYAQKLIRSVDGPSLSEYRIAHWLDRNRPAERTFIPGSGSFLFNIFTDNPQLHGGHDQHTLNSFIPIVDFTVCSGTNAGSRDADYSIFWLKAFGVGTVVVSGPGSTDWYKPIAHPAKFEGRLPLLWRDRGDSIYAVSPRSPSLAHVIPASAVVTRRPIHGLDIGPAEAYVAALEDPQYPLAGFQWTAMDQAEIRTTATPEQVIAVQITYERGWEATANGRAVSVRGDAIGQMVIAPGCNGTCNLSLQYTGGNERIATRAMSVTAMLTALVWALRRRAKHRLS